MFFFFLVQKFAACTVHKLSYIPNDYKHLLPIKSYAPERKYQPSDVPMESETTMRLSYQPVGPVDKIEKPWAAKLAFHRSVTPMEDNTTYNLRFLFSLSIFLFVTNSRVSQVFAVFFIATYHREHSSRCKLVPLLVFPPTPTKVNFLRKKIVLNVCIEKLSQK